MRQSGAFDDEVNLTGIKPDCVQIEGQIRFDQRV